jgi:SAM-dependent methyltransferase
VDETNFRGTKKLLPETQDTIGAHGADPQFKLNQELRLREKIGSAAQAERYVNRLIKKHFVGRPASSIRVLDVGTGQGFAVKALRNLGYDAWGLEPGGRLDDAEPGVRPFIYRVYSQDLLNQHPEIERFDFIFSSGVVEHVGTTDGNSDLVENYREYRKVFMESQLSLLRVGGILCVTGPNRLFPFDFQHGDHYYHSILKVLDRLPVLKNATIPWHPRNHLVSYRDLQKIAAALPYKVEFLYESQADYSSMTKIRKFALLKVIFLTYIKAVSALPFAIRQYLETHTVFICRLTAE